MPDATDVKTKRRGGRAKGIQGKRGGETITLKMPKKVLMAMPNKQLLTLLKYAAE